MAERSKIAFGSLDRIEYALEQNIINVNDIICLEEKKIGWIDKEGNPVIVESEEYVIPVSELPTVDGKSNVIYLYNNQGFVWNGEKCVPMSQDAEVAELTDSVNALEAEMENKVDEATVDAKIAEALTGFEVVEF